MYSTDEALMRRYLLGMVPEEEQVRIEERFFTDNSRYDELQAIENELFYEYAQDELSASERAAFEDRFLNTPEDRQRLATAKALVRRIVKSAKPAFLSPDASAGSASAWRFGDSVRTLRWAAAAAVLFVFMATGWLLVETGRLKREVVRVASEAERRDRAVAEMAEALARRERGTVAAEEGRRASVPSASPQQDTGRVTREPSVISLMLSPGLVRGETEATRIMLPPGTDVLRLELIVKPDAHHSQYRATLSNADGRQVWRGRATLGAATAPRRLVTATIPARAVAPGDYELTLEGATAAGEWEPLAEYYFSIRS